MSKAERDDKTDKPADTSDKRQLLEDKPFDYIERTKPEDRLEGTSHQGQLTRDNVNPNIPSVAPGTGDIVDPHTLGMDQGQRGVQPPPPAADQRELWPKTKEQGAAPGQQHTEAQEQALEQRLTSINEPPGSNITTGDAGPAELPPLVLSDISPDTMVIGSGTFPLTVTGSGFIPDCVVVFDDAEVPTSFVSPTELRADCPAADLAGVVDVEVHRGEDMSDVLSFEFTAVALMSRGEKKPPERKPKKNTPTHKRANKRK